ncbi:MAG TPA: hypothetical protein PLE33_05765 [Candidatus Cloacimonas sp.]|nr:hypothetical protein [Candidatus Cloacimonas sp.]HPS60751.1 hypothetical protein [Candidatus Cloacimonas sp.]
MAEIDEQTIKDIYTFMGEIRTKTGNIESSIKEGKDREANCQKGFNKRIISIEVKQQRFAWYVGLAAGLGMAIMFVFDKVVDWIINARKI